MCISYSISLQFDEVIYRYYVEGMRGPRFGQQAHWGAIHSFCPYILLVANSDRRDENGINEDECVKWVGWNEGFLSLFAWFICFSKRPVYSIMTIRMVLLTLLTTEARSCHLSPISLPSLPFCFCSKLGQISRDSDSPTERVALTSEKPRGFYFFKQFVNTVICPNTAQ